VPNTVIENNFLFKKLVMKKIFFMCCLISTATMVCLPSASQVKQEFDDLIFYIPSSLSFYKTENRLLIKDSTLPIGQEYSITIDKSVLSLKKIEKSFPVFWRESLSNQGVDSPVAGPAFFKSQTPTGWSCFRGGKMVAYNTQVPAFYYHLIVLRYLGITVKIATHASSEEIFLQKYPQLIQMISNVNFKTPPPKQPTNSQQTDSTKKVW